VSLTVYNGNLIAGGFFDAAGGTSASRIARWNGTNWAPLGTGANGDIESLTVFNGNLIAGGQFTTAGGTSTSHIAQWNGTSWAPLGTGANDVVRTLTVYNSYLIAGGDFVTTGGNPSAYWARWGSSCSPGDLNCDGMVNAADVGPLVAGLVNPSTLDGCTSH